MDLAYQLTKNLDSIPIDNILLVNSKVAYDTVMQHIFPQFSTMVVVSAEEGGPEHDALRAKIISVLETNPNVRVAVLCSEALSKIKVVSKKIIILDDILLTQFRTNKSFAKAVGLEMNLQKLGHFLKVWFIDQEKRLHYSHHVSNYINNALEYTIKDQEIAKLLS